MPTSICKSLLACRLDSERPAPELVLSAVESACQLDGFGCGCGVPEGVDGDGSEAVSEGEGLLAGVEDVSGDESFA